MDSCKGCKGLFQGGTLIDEVHKGSIYVQASRFFKRPEKMETGFGHLTRTYKGRVLVSIQAPIHTGPNKEF